jgi:hypothetical protein
METPTFKRKISFALAKAQFIHRFTMEHVPAWSRNVRDCGGYPAPQFASDLEWYNATRFKGEPGWFGDDDSCFTMGQTWPLGRRLVRPYVKGT